jgi:ABC-2 type transport system permease protein
MKSFPLLFKDELKGFYKSKVMLLLWLGMPVLVLIIHIWNPGSKEEMPLAMVSALTFSSISGTLASVMLAVGIVHEKSKGVYSLFLIRPVKRRHILLSKFFSVYGCIAVAALIILAFGFAFDYLNQGGITQDVFRQTVMSLVMSFSMMAISSSAGVLIGVISPSVLVSVILVLYGGNQLSALGFLPYMLKLPNPMLIMVIVGILVAVLLLSFSVLLFNKKQF